MAARLAEHPLGFNEVATQPKELAALITSAAHRGLGTVGQVPARAWGRPPSTPPRPHEQAGL